MTTATIVLKGGEGSGDFGHAGRPGLVGGSSPEGGIVTKLSEDDPYIQDLQKHILYLVDKKYRGAMNAPDVLSHMGFRVFRGQGNLLVDYAMAKYIEDRTDRETMLSVMDSQGNWTGSPRSCPKEWAAIEQLYGVPIPDGVTKVELSDKELEGFKARQEFMQAVFKEKYGDEAKMYRGVEGPYARKVIREIGARKQSVKFGEDVSMDFDVKAYGLSSFSSDSRSARQFAGQVMKRGGRGMTSMKGVLFSYNVKASDVWILPRDAGVTSPIRFAEDNGEVVIYNPDKMRKWHVEDYA